jgi:hypothetical protein
MEVIAPFLAPSLRVLGSSVVVTRILQREAR